MDGQTFFAPILTDALFSVRTLPVAPLWCDLGFFPNSRGNKAAANLRPMKTKFVTAARAARPYMDGQTFRANLNGCPLLCYEDKVCYGRARGVARSIFVLRRGVGGRGVCQCPRRGAVEGLRRAGAVRIETRRRGPRRASGMGAARTRTHAHTLVAVRQAGR